MDIPTIPGALYTVATKTTCDITDTATGTPIDTVTAGSITFAAQGAATTLSDPSATYSKVNFKNAAAALRMLGGGDKLPEGYLAADFVQFDGNDYVPLPFTTAARDSITWGMSVQFFKNTTGKQAEGKNGVPYFFVGLDVDQWYFGVNSAVLYTNIENDFSWHNLTLSYSAGFTGLKFDNKTFNNTYVSSAVVLPNGLYIGISLNGASYCNNRKKRIIVKKNEETIFNLIPCITSAGTAAVYDQAKNKTIYSNYKRLRAGLTLAQARKLGQLPTGGGTLKIALPDNYTDDEYVQEAIETATSKGWVFDIGTYSSATPAGAASFALRRIWVRKTADPEGNYIDENGARYFVESCQYMYGADPTDLGYAPFRSVDVALAEWKLSPYIPPEEEP